MKETQGGNFNWKDMQDKAQQFLGEDFLSKITQAMPRRSPNIDMYRTNNEVVVVMEIPGVSEPGMVNITMRGYILLIYGSIPRNYPASADNILIKERFTGEFRREIELPHYVAVNKKIEAKFRYGLLEVHVPIEEFDSPKEITIKYE